MNRLRFSSFYVVSKVKDRIQRNTVHTDLSLTKEVHSNQYIYFLQVLASQQLEHVSEDVLKVHSNFPLLHPKVADPDVH